MSVTLNKVELVATQDLEAEALDRQRALELFLDQARHSCHERT